MKLVYTFCIVLFINACSSTQNVVIDSSYKFQDKPTVTILSQSIKENTLTLKVQYSGCKNDIITLNGNGMVKKSNPPIMRLEAINKHTENCSEIIVKTIRYDISSIKYNDTEEKNTLNLYLNNSETPIEYVY